jgi:hypothetical protein
MSGTSSERYAGKGSRRAAASKNGWRGFVDISVGKDGKTYVQESMFVEAADVVGELEAIIEDGYKLSVTEDTANGCVIVSATGRTCLDANRGLTLSARGPDFAAGLHMLAYKMYHLAQGGAWENVPGQSGGDPWG